MATDEIDLDQLVATIPTASNGDGLTLDGGSLKLLWEKVVAESTADDFRVFEEAYRATAVKSGDFHVQSGGWTCHLSRGLAKGVLLGPLVAAALVLS